MNSAELSYFLQKNIITRRTFNGVFARDQLKHIQVPKNRPSSFVLNTEPLRIPIGHWICVYFIPNTDTAIYMDSFALPPLHKDVEKFLKKWASKIYYNKRMIQDVTSSACGLYVMYFIYKLSQGTPMLKLLQPFHPIKTRQNDKKVSCFIQQRFKKL